MSRLLSWLRFYRSTAAIRAARSWQAESLHLLSRLAKRQKSLTQLERRLEDLRSKLDADLLRATELEENHKIVVDSLRAENDVLARSTIPTLVASHKLLLQRIDAETALEVRRAVALRTGGERE